MAQPNVVPVEKIHLSLFYVPRFFFFLVSMFSPFLAVYLRVLIEKQCQLKFLANLYLPCLYLQVWVGRTDMALSGICASGTQRYSN